ALHAAEADLTREAAVAQEEAEAVRGVEVALALPGRAARPERLTVDRRVRRARLAPRLPLLEPVATAQPHLAPRAPVVAAQRSEQTRGADELDRVGGARHRPRL